MSETTELAVLPRAALPTILAADTNDVFGKLARELAAFEPDATTPQGRAEIGSKATKVGKAKMELVRLANGLTEGWRASTAAVVAERKVIEERMDSLRKQIEAPRDEYNAREKNRVEIHESRIKTLEDAAQLSEHATSWEIAKDIDTFSELYADCDFEEFAAKAHKARTNTLNAMRVAYQATKTREDEAEASRVAAIEAVERQRVEAEAARQAREEQIAREAAEAARQAAEAEAARQAREAEEKAQAALAMAEALRVHQATEAERREKEAALALAEAEQRAEQERDAAAERERVIRERERLSAEQAERAMAEAAKKAEVDRLAAIEAERARVAKEAAAQKAKDDARAADTAHRGKINREAMEDIYNVLLALLPPDGTAEPLARAVVKALAKRAIRHCRVEY